MGWFLFLLHDNLAVHRYIRTHTYLYVQINANQLNGYHNCMYVTLSIILEWKIEMFDTKQNFRWTVKLCGLLEFVDLKNFISGCFTQNLHHTDIRAGVNVIFVPFFFLLYLCIVSVEYNFNWLDSIWPGFLWESSHNNLILRYSSHKCALNSKKFIATLMVAWTHCL